MPPPLLMGAPPTPEELVRGKQVLEKCGQRLNMTPPSDLPSPPRSPVQSHPCDPCKHIQGPLILLLLLSNVLGIPCCESKLSTFVRAIVERGNVSHSTLEASVVYLIYLARRSEPVPLHCFRRLWLSSLILASKFLEDQNYTLRAWCHLSGLSMKELKSNEMAVLDALNFDLCLDDNTLSNVSALMERKPATPISTLCGIDLGMARPALAVHATNKRRHEGTEQHHKRVKVACPFA